MKALGERAKVGRVTPHCFLDTFACDMLARGTSIYDVAKMLADTVDNTREALRKQIAEHLPQDLIEALQGQAKEIAMGDGIDVRQEIFAKLEI
jgi:integrase